MNKIYFVVYCLLLIPLALSCSPPPAEAPAKSADQYAAEREAMVSSQLAARDITDPRVLEAMRKVPRHLFVPPYLAGSAYDDKPLPIGHGQTISQPYIVALMTQLLELPDKGARVLEVGTGSGYQAAVLSELASEVYTVEIIPELAESAARRLKELGYDNVRVKTGDGYYAWEEYAPFDGIIVTAAATHVPPPLIKQLKDGGRIVIPLGSAYSIQGLTVVEKKGGKVTEKSVIPVRFVPLTGGHEKG